MKRNLTKKFLSFVTLSTLAVSCLVGLTKITAAEGDYVGRAYNDAYDQVLDDFSSATPKGTPSNADDYLAKPYLLVPIDNVTSTEKFGNTPDSAIYKYASGVYAFEEYQLGLRIKLVSGTLANADLTLALRGGDAFKTYPLTFDTLLDENANPIANLTNEYQDIVIDIAGSLVDDTVVYENTDGTPSTTRVLSEILGLHIYAKDDTVATLAIEKVYLLKTGTETLMDDFTRVDVGAPDANCWWRGSVGYIVGRHVELKAGSSYSVSDAAAAATGYENIVVSLKAVDAIVDGLVVTPIYVAGEGTETAYANLKGADGAALPALSNAYQNLVINYVQSGWNADVVGIKIASTSAVAVNSIFFTNLETKEIIDEYPRLDFTGVTVFDNFNRTQSGFNGDYDASATNPLVVNNGLFYALSYNNGDKVTIADGSLIYDAMNLVGEDWINFKEGSSRARASEEYLVLKVKATDGASLERFEVNGVVGSNWYSAEGLKVPSLDAANYPYTDGDWKYIIIDLALTGMTITDVFDSYYRGTGKLYIDQIFFADKVAQEYDTANKVVASSEGTIDFTDGGYKYYYGGSGNTNKYPYLAITMKGSVGTTLGSFRIGFAGGSNVGEKWVKDGALVGLTSDALTTEYQTFYIDLLASDVDLNINDLHFHFGAHEGLTGIVDIQEVAYVGLVPFAQTVNTDLVVDFSAGGYKYQYGGGANVNRYPYLALTMSGSEGTTLGSFRMETSGGKAPQTLWVKDNALVGLTSDALTTEPQTFIVDLKASGIATDFEHLHFHFGDFEGLTGLVNIQKVEYLGYYPSYADLMSNLEEADITRPVVTYNPVATAFAGTTITVNPTATDDVTNPENITWTRTVIKGSGDEAETITLDANNAFVAEVGIYNITVVGTDEAGNSHSVSAQITVTAPDTTKPVITYTPATGIKAGDTVTVNPTATDDVTDAANLVWEITVKKGTEVVTLDANKTFVAAEGTYTITIKVTDEAGNAETMSKDITVSSADTTKPTINFTIPTTIEIGDTITVNPTATDDVTSTSNLTWEIVVKKGTEVVTLDSNKSFEVEEGTYLITVKVTDEAGNVATLSRSIIAKTTTTTGGLGIEWYIGIGSFIGLVVVVGAFFIFRKKASPIK